MDTHPDRSRALQAVLARSTKDRAFRERLLTDPRGAVRDAFGILIPPEITIRFVERDAGVDALIVLPPFESESDGEELSEAELESVAGGTETNPYAWSDPPPDPP